MEFIDGKIVLGIEDAPLVDALAAWTDRVQARIVTDAAKAKTEAAAMRGRILPPLS
jgi:hypothetical protein